MHIDTDLLFTWGAVAKKYKKNSVIFYEHDCASFYYQVYEGTVRMYYTNDDGREFTLGLFNEGNSFGEPPLFNESSYPASSIAKTDCVVIKLAKEKLFAILREYPTLNTSFLKLFANRIYNKVLTTKQIISQKPEYRLTGFLSNYKKQLAVQDKPVLIPFTRQEIADFTYLRVETVIRTLTAMHKDGTIVINDHKLYY